MEYSDVKAWLDELAEDFKRATRNKVLSTDIVACAAAISNRVLVYSGIEIIADIMGLGLKEEEINLSDGTTSYKYFFIYSDVEFAHFIDRRK